MPMFRLIARNENCVLLEYISRRRYKVRDIEDDDIYIGNDFEHAKEIFDTYDINKVREKRKENLEKWLREFVES